MVTEDDARTTIDAGDRYVIQPAFKDWSVDPGVWPDTKLVAENFRYSSDSNSEWLVGEKLLKMIVGSAK